MEKQRQEQVHEMDKVKKEMIMMELKNSIANKTI